MEIRKLVPKDAANYRSIRLMALKNHPEAFSSSYEEGKELSAEVYESRLASSYSFTFGAIENEKIVGVVTLVLEQKNKIKHRATIFAMYVLPEQRGMGVGKRLMAKALQKAKEERNIEQVYLSVAASNQPAKKLYQSMKFTTYGVDKKALKVEDTYFDEELMVLYL